MSNRLQLDLANNNVANGISIRAVGSRDGGCDYGPTAKRFSCVPSMFDSLGVKVPYPT